MAKNHDILIWDNHGTIMKAKNPSDNSADYNQLFPNVERLMNSATVNIICSGCKQIGFDVPRDFDVQSTADRFQQTMSELPVTMTVFSPKADGSHCYAIMKKDDGSFELREMHTDARYVKYHKEAAFKKPDLGMYMVIKDLLAEQGHDFDAATMVGDSWHDEDGAKNAGIRFLHATKVHEMTK